MLFFAYLPLLVHLGLVSFAEQSSKDTSAILGKCPPTTRLNQPSPIENENLICASHGGKPVGDEHDRHTPMQSIDRCLHREFGFAIERAGGFIEYEQGWTAQESPG